MTVETYDLAGLPVAARLPDDTPLTGQLARLLAPAGVARADTHVTVTFDRDKASYHVAGAGVAQPFTCRDSLDAACGVVAGLIGGYALETTSHLCLHGAAFVHGGRAYVIPNTYKAGKSAFSAAWVAACGDLITDDAVLIAIDGFRVTSFGSPPRIRKTLLDNAPEALRRYITAHIVLDCPRIAYLDIGARQVPPERPLPFGGWLFLDRGEIRTPTLARMPVSEALTQIIWQNLARRRLASELLGILTELAVAAPCYRLSYGEAVDAVPVLKAGLDADPARLDMATAIASVATGPDYSHLTVSETEAGLYIANDQNGRMFYLNASAGLMWKIATSGLGREEALATLAALYPDQEAQALAKDYDETISRLADSGLVARSLLRLG